MKLIYVHIGQFLGGDTDVLCSSLNLDTSDGFRHVGNFMLLIVSRFEKVRPH